MLLRYFYDDKLAHASYLVGCQATGEAIVIDPARNIAPYLRTAEAENMRIVATTETHIHADFVSGVRELVDKAGAHAFLSNAGPPDWQYAFAKQDGATLLADGDSWSIGRIRFEAIHTPGHTPEHMSFLLTDTAGASRPMGVFSGDFIFVGDVGRPDLLETAAGVAGSKETGAKQLFASLQAFKEREDYLQIWPGHGAGSACGKALGAVPTSTLGYEKMFNWAFSVDNEAEFVEKVLEGQNDPPAYFRMMKIINRRGPALLDPEKPVPELDWPEFERLLSNRAWIIDTRPKTDYAQGHIPGTISLPLTRSIASLGGWILPYDQPLYLIATRDNVQEIRNALQEIGLDDIAGFATPEVVEKWRGQNGGTLEQLELGQIPDIAAAIESGELPVIDVRTRQEYDAGHPANAQHIQMGELRTRAGEVPSDQKVAISCKTGGRSFVAASMLQSMGVRNVMNLEGGFEGWKSENRMTARPEPVS